MSLQSRLAAFISAVGADIKTLYAMSGYHAHVRRSGSASIPADPTAGSFVAISWDVEVKDVDDLHSASFLSRLTPKRAGPAVVNATLSISTSITSGFLDARLIVTKAAGGTEQIGVGTISNGSYVNVSGEYDFALGDYVECWIFNKTNGTQTLAGGAGTSQMTITSGKGIKGDTGPVGNVNALDENGYVRWNRAADGALIAEHVVATSAGADKTATLTERASAAGNGIATVLLEAKNGTPASRLRVKNDPTQSTRKRKVTAEVYDDSGTVLLSRDILRSDGSSDLGHPLVVDVLPTVGVNDGDEVYFQNTSMANNGIVWHLRYNANSPNTHKWEFVGGSVFYARDPALVQSGSPSVNAAGPSHTIPLAGYYEVTMSFNAFPNGNNGLVQADLYNASNVAIDSTAEEFIQGWVNAAGPTRFQGHRTSLLPIALAAGSTMKMGYSGDNTGIGIRFRSLGIKPIRVSG